MPSAVLYASAPLVAALDFLNPEKILQWLGPFATIGLFLIIFAESGLLFGFFLPGDSLLFAAGLFAVRGEYLAPLPVILVGCFVAAVAGDQVGYLFGKKVGPALFSRPDSRFFRQDHVKRAHDFFEHHGAKTILLARFVPVVRTFAPILAGVGEMPYRTFVSYNVIGGLLWAVGITTLGATLGHLIGPDKIDKYLLPIIFLIVLLSVVPAIFEVRRHRRAAAGPPVGPLPGSVAEQVAADLRDTVDD
ncbi:MAG: VTT domain-containing protein [Acidimicrobiia bacterium]|nr:VTT domain-containing protein [Acidimicrobiia bacterium]MCL4291847.1 VTT domain-containing protein [Acidimicrobiia bacterium]